MNSCPGLALEADNLIHIVDFWSAQSLDTLSGINRPKQVLFHTQSVKKIELPRILQAKMPGMDAAGKLKALNALARGHPEVSNV